MSLLDYRTSLKLFGPLYEDITDEMIQSFLDRPQNPQKEPSISYCEHPNEHDAEKIAFFVRLLQQDPKLDLGIDKIGVCKEGTALNIFDHCHQIRAYQFLKRPVPIYIHEYYPMSHSLRRTLKRARRKARKEQK